MGGGKGHNIEVRFLLHGKGRDDGGGGGGGAYPDRGLMLVPPLSLLLTAHSVLCISRWFKKL